jgi:hypothetical protein
MHGEAGGMIYPSPSLATIASGELEGLHRKLSALRPQQAKWFLNNLHLEQKISATDLAYWMDTLEIDPSL